MSVKNGGESSLFGGVQGAIGGDSARFCPTLDVKSVSQKGELDGITLELDDQTVDES